MWNLEKIFFVSLQKLFSFTRKSNFRTLNIEISWNAWNKKFILLSNLWSKHSRLMKFGQFMSYYKSKKISKFFTKTANWKLDPDTFKHSLYWKMKQATYIRYVWPRHADLLRLPFTEDPLKIEKGLEVVSRSHFS